MQCFQNEINYPENADKKETSSQMNSCTRINHMLIYSLTSDTFVEADFFFFLSDVGNSNPIFKGETFFRLMGKT